MNNNNDEKLKQEKIKNIIANPRRQDKLSDDKKREFIARLYKVGDERKHITPFIPGIKVRVFSGAAVLVVLVMAFTYLFSPLYPVITNVKGTVKIYRASKNEWVFAENSGTRLGKNDILKTFDDGQADLIIPKVYHIRLKKDSEIRLAKSISRTISQDSGYILEKGKLLAYYNKYRRIGKELEIVTPQAIATALGTDFMVASTPLLNQTTIGVLDGVVKVNSSLPSGSAIQVPTEVMVRAGERTTVHKGDAPDKPTPLLEDELLNMEELYNIGTRPQVALLISTGPTRTRELLAVTPLYVASDKTGALPEKLGSIVNKFNQAIREGSKEKNLENIKEFEDIINNYPNPKYDVQFLLFIGSYYEYIGEYQRAITTFERVVNRYPNSGLASIAQCAIGIIYEERFKNLDSAKTAYQKVISNYPHSPEAEEATAGLNRLTQ